MSPRLQSLLKPLSLPRRKERGKQLKSPSPRVVMPTCPTFTSSTLKIPNLLPPRPRGRLRLCSNPDKPTSNFSKRFPTYRSSWKSSKRRWDCSARRLPSKKTQQLVFRPDSSSKSTHTTKIAVSPNYKRKTQAPRRRSVTKRLRKPLAARSATGRRLAMMASAPKTPSIPAARVPSH